MHIDPEFQFNYDLAYYVYSKSYDHWDTMTSRAKVRARRYVEAGIAESIQFKGTKTNLISEKAFQAVLAERKKQSVLRGDRKSTEHPITHRHIAMYCLTRPTKMSFTEYFAFWFGTLVWTWVTSDENQLLKKAQKSFDIATDDWRTMYDNAGIKLMEMPRLSTHKEKRKYGIIE
jgi:hypothetical protein